MASSDINSSPSNEEIINLSLSSPEATLSCLQELSSEISPMVIGMIGQLLRECLLTGTPAESVARALYTLYNEHRNTAEVLGSEVAYLDEYFDPYMHSSADGVRELHELLDRIPPIPLPLS